MAKVSEVSIGSVFGQLTITDLFQKGRNVVSVCLCTCGKVKEIRVSSLGNSTTSCGCSQYLKSTTHGMSKTRIYDIWIKMQERCTKPTSKDYHNYGGRGITISEGWKDFTTFFKDMGDNPRGLSLERVNNLLGYSKENCEWATPAKQSRNTRRNIKIIHNTVGVMVLTDAIALANLSYRTVKARLRSGWSLQRALESTEFNYVKESI